MSLRSFSQACGWGLGLPGSWFRVHVKAGLVFREECSERDRGAVEKRRARKVVPGVLGNGRKGARKWDEGRQGMGLMHQ